MRLVTFLHLYFTKRLRVVYEPRTLKKEKIRHLACNYIIFLGSFLTLLSTHHHITYYYDMIGGPLICAVAKSVLDRISAPDFLESVRSKGSYMVERLRKLPHGGKVTEIRHAGGIFSLSPLSFLSSPLSLLPPPSLPPGQ
jgi:hypothetical protein